MIRADVPSASGKWQSRSCRRPGTGSSSTEGSTEVRVLPFPYPHHGPCMSFHQPRGVDADSRQAGREAYASCLLNNRRRDSPAGSNPALAVRYALHIASFIAGCRQTPAGIRVSCGRWLNGRAPDCGSGGCGFESHPSTGCMDASFSGRTRVSKTRDGSSTLSASVGWHTGKGHRKAPPASFCRISGR